MKLTSEFFENKNINLVINLLSELLEIDKDILTSEFKKYDYSGTEFFDKLLNKLDNKNISEIKEVKWYRLADAYDLMGEPYK